MSNLIDELVWEIEKLKIYNGVVGNKCRFLHPNCGLELVPKKNVIRTIRKFYAKKGRDKMKTNVEKKTWEKT